MIKAIMVITAMSGGSLTSPVSIETVQFPSLGSCNLAATNLLLKWNKDRFTEETWIKRTVECVEYVE